MDRYDAHNSAAIDYQRGADASEGPEVNRLLAVVDREGGGRVYAGMPSNWGASLRVGAVPVFKYLESKDVEEVGYTLRTASLMTDPEYYFDQDNPSDYALFGVRYLILPAGWVAPVPARLLMRAGPYALWRIAGSGYIHVGRIVGGLSANRSDLGPGSIPLLRSALAQNGDYLRVAFGGAARGATTGSSPPTPGSAAGRVISEHVDLIRGEAAATVRMRRPGVAVLSASFDPGWTATVDGRRQKTEMVAPALVAVPVAAGTTTIIFRYRGFADYPLLFALAALTLIVLLGVGVRSRRRR
jgi:Bacterial membrane protein YfhO